MGQPFNSLERKPLFSRSMLAFIAFLGIALFFLFSEHRVHALGWLPLILLLACPLLHMFMHGSHGGHSGGHSGHNSQPTDRSARTQEPGLNEEIV